MSFQQSIINVVKFGGSSMCPKGYKQMIRRVKESVDSGEDIIVVVSAIGKTTNALIDFIHGNTKNLDKVKEITNDIFTKMGIKSEELESTMSTLDTLVKEFNELPTIDITQHKLKIVSMGEIISSWVLHHILHKAGFENKLLNARRFIKSVNSHKSIDASNLSMGGKFYCDGHILKSMMDKDINVYVTQGFIASTRDEKYCILTRSGSDTTASLIASGLDSKQLEIWTDVNGMFTADPRVVPEAKVIGEIDYDTCQEVSIAGSQVLHPFCIIPCKMKKIPILVKNTFDPDGEFTTVKSLESIKQSSKENRIYAVSKNDRITVFSIESPDMWQGCGFVCDIFKVFSEHQVDVNIINTSYTSVSTTTEEKSTHKLWAVFKALMAKYGDSQVNMVENCSIVSIIADNVKTNPDICKSMDIINSICEDGLYIKHYSDNNRNYSMVVDGKISTNLAKTFHREFIKCGEVTTVNPDTWWREDKVLSKLLYLNSAKLLNKPVYVYNTEKIKEQCTKLTRQLQPTVKHFYYAIKANSNYTVINTVLDWGFGLECVSIEELYSLLHIMTNRKERIDPDKVIFTPNYCLVKDYERAFQFGVMVIVDNIEVVLENPKIFSNKRFGVRLDLDQGDGHNKKVVTEGKHVKFGFQLSDIDTLLTFCKDHGSTIVMLHSHKGSGILDYKAWGQTLAKMNTILAKFPDVKKIDLGGGLGIWKNGKELDLDAMREEIEKNIVNPDIELSIEPGRFVVAESGVIVTKVSQIRHKGNKKYVGITAGMHTLVRPMLYGAYHPIHNISDICNKDEDNEDSEKQTVMEKCDVVGPICESGDILGKDVDLPKSTKVEDVILIDNAGAYGHVMASNYNSKSKPNEIILYKSQHYLKVGQWEFL